MITVALLLRRYLVEAWIALVVTSAVGTLLPDPYALAASIVGLLELAFLCGFSLCSLIVSRVTEKFIDALPRLALIELDSVRRERATKRQQRELN